MHVSRNGRPRDRVRGSGISTCPIFRRPASARERNFTILDREISHHTNSSAEEFDGPKFRSASSNQPFLSLLILAASADGFHRGRCCRGGDAFAPLVIMAPPG